MPWCPRCRIEYREGFTKCSDCETELTNDLEPLQVEEYDKESYLMTVANSIEANIIEGLLEAYKIPVLKKFQESGAYLDVYMGSSNLGVSLYVPSKMLEKAKDVTQSSYYLFEDESQEISEDYSIEMGEEIKRQNAMQWLLFLLFLPTILAIGLYIIHNFFR